MIRTVTFLPVLILVASGCGSSTEESDSASGDIVHPTLESFPEDEDLADTIGMRRGDHRDDGAMYRYARAMLDAEEVLTIGAREGGRDQLLGEVKDVAAGEDGTIYVLDAQNYEVRAYHAGRSLVGTYGREGEGPDEFRTPEDLEWTLDNRVIVADRDRRVKVLEARDASLALAHTVSLDFTPESMSLLDSLLLIQGFQRDEGTVHLYSTAGERVRSFGPVYQSDHPDARASLSSGIWWAR